MLAGVKGDFRGGVDAVILVGGLGTRLRPLTLSVPKPMLPTAGVPLLAHLVARVRDAGVQHVVLGTSYRAEVFESYFGTGAGLGVELEYVVEEEPLGTGGGIRNVADRLRGDTTLILNGDVLSAVDIPRLLAEHRAAHADVTLYLTKVDDPRQYGCVPTDADGRVLAFLEKTPTPVSDQINAGAYVFRRGVVNTIPAGRPVSVERETFPGLLNSGAVVAGYLDHGYWRDVGRPSDFVAGSADLVRGVIASSALPRPTGEALFVGTSKVAASAVVTGGSAVGSETEIADGAQVDASVLFDGAFVGAGALVRRSALGFGAVVRDGAVVEDCVIGDRAVVGRYVQLRGGARVWPDAVVPDGSITFGSEPPPGD
jgi:mannose-1-phosphate guanylyltransferase